VQAFHPGGLVRRLHAVEVVEDIRLKMIASQKEIARNAPACFRYRGRENIGHNWS